MYLFQRIESLTLFKINIYIYIYIYIYLFIYIVGLGGLVVTCSPRDPRFAGSKPTEVDFFRT